MKDGVYNKNSVVPHTGLSLATAAVQLSIAAWLGDQLSWEDRERSEFSK